MRKVIVGLKEIGKVLSCEKGTVGRMIKEDGLPAVKMSDGIYRTTEALIAEWVETKVGENQCQ